MKIFKYELGLNVINVEMHVGAELLSCHVQNDVICIWALVNPHKEKEVRKFEIIGTGQTIVQVPDDWTRKFVATVQDGSYVWHVFELRKIILKKIAEARFELDDDDNQTKNELFN